MTTRTLLSGRYEIVNEALFREKANRDDPRRPFYAAMLANRAYEAYLAEVGHKAVEVPGYKANPITGRMEILYCRRNGWIADAGNSR
ncbi:MAG TPA: hypothetical protein VKS60_12800 [Stellaceae bacterium]|nr:hypothetical protein [Stellaceae bacterium]